MNPKPTIFALDFGTTNSLLAAAAKGHTFEPVPLDPTAADPSILRSAMHFTSAEDIAFGAAAVRRFVDSGLRGRLLRSIKRHLGSESFVATRINGRRMTIEELAGSFLRFMRERACRHFDVDIDRAVIGRPARFSHRPEEDALAEDRLREAARLAGFRE
ncbi:MAG: Hsp70 family protein, partial [Myxococcales bacterium]